MISMVAFFELLDVFMVFFPHSSLFHEEVVIQTHLVFSW